MSAPAASFIRSNVIGFIALFVALSAGAYATTVAHRNSVVSKSIKNGQVKRVDLARGAVTAAKVSADGLGGASIDESSLDSSILQHRLDKSCGGGEAIQAVDAQGAVTCRSVGGSAGGTVTQVNSGFGLSGGPFTSSGTLSVNDQAVQRRVTGTCTGSKSIQSIDQSGTASCGGPVTRIHGLVASSNENYGGAAVLAEPGHTELLGLCHSQLANGSDPTITGTKLLFETPYNDSGDTLNWFYSDGSTVSANGAALVPSKFQEFSFLGKRIEGQFIFSEAGTADSTFSIHAYDGGSFCEFAGTVVRAT